MQILHLADILLPQVLRYSQAPFTLDELFSQDPGVTGYPPRFLRQLERDGCQPALALRLLPVPPASQFFGSQGVYAYTGVNAWDLLCGTMLRHPGW